MDDLKIFEEQNGSLQEKYNAWRKNAEKENLPQYKIDCAFQEARKKIFRILQSERDNSFPCYVSL